MSDAPTPHTDGESVRCPPPCARLSRARFPYKLHELLDEADANGHTDIVSWLPDGASFKVFCVKSFASTVQPKYFRTGVYKSFQRNLNIWGFKRDVTGAIRHTYFRRLRQDLCLKMARFGGEPKVPMDLDINLRSTTVIDNKTQSQRSISVFESSLQDSATDATPVEANAGKKALSQAQDIKRVAAYQSTSDGLNSRVHSSRSPSRDSTFSLQDPHSQSSSSSLAPDSVKTDPFVFPCALPCFDSTASPNALASIVRILLPTPESLSPQSPELKALGILFREFVKHFAAFATMQVELERQHRLANTRA